jgi:hypothetical protein
MNALIENINTKTTPTLASVGFKDACLQLYLLPRAAQLSGGMLYKARRRPTVGEPDVVALIYQLKGQAVCRGDKHFAALH